MQFHQRKRRRMDAIVQSLHMPRRQIKDGSMRRSFRPNNLPFRLLLDSQRIYQPFRWPFLHIIAGHSLQLQHMQLLPVHHQPS